VSAERAASNTPARHPRQSSRQKNITEVTCVCTCPGAMRMPVTFTDIGHLLYCRKFACPNLLPKTTNLLAWTGSRALQQAGTIFLNVDASTSDCGFRGRIGFIPLALCAAACARVCFADLWRWRRGARVARNAP